jgi:hypothetical protein
MNPIDQALLRATLLTGPEALADFHRWRSAIDLDQLPPAHYPLLSMLVARLETFGVEPEARLTGLRRRAWYVNQIALRTLTVARQTLFAADLTPVLIGDAAFAQASYPIDQLRPIETAALLIPAAQASRAIRALRDQSWRPQPVTAQIDASAFYVWRSACLFIREDGSRFELRWHALPDLPTAALEAALWRHGIIPGPDILTPLKLSATALLLLACATATGPTTRSLIALADVITLLRSDQAVDWPWLIETAALAGLTSSILTVLETAHALIRIDIPNHVWRQLRAAQRVVGPRVSTGLARRPAAGWHRHVIRFRQIAGAQAQTPSPAAFLDYLQNQWGLAQRREVLIRLIRRGVRYARRSG